jgi:hypothetical protein
LFNFEGPGWEAKEKKQEAGEIRRLASSLLSPEKVFAVE